MLYSRLTLGILSKLALRHQSGNLNLNVSPTGGVCIGTLGGATGSTTDMLVGQLVAAKLGMRRGSGSSRRRGSGDSSSGTIDPSFICHVCNERQVLSPAYCAIISFVILQLISTI